MALSGVETEQGTPARARAALMDYVSIARPEHWFKNLLAIPGALVAALLGQTPARSVLPSLLIGAVAICVVASANYVLNEWVDRDSDRHHPIKSQRPSVTAALSPICVVVEYLLLALCGLALGVHVSWPFVVCLGLLLFQGLVYNVRPLRTKDRAYLDVVSEAINNPIRLMLGWFIVTSAILPPSSLVIGYWMAGAFLMSMKRFAEYRFIGDETVAGLYRESFRHYTDDRLLIASFFYGVFSSFLLGIFMIKYRIELVLAFPLFSILFSWYLRLGLSDVSPVQAPEKLYRERGFIAFLIFVVAVVALLLSVDLPWLHILLDTTYIRVPGS